MISRKLMFVVPVAALVFVSGCRSTSSRTAYYTQPAVVAAVPAPACAVPVAPACPAAVVPAAPPGFIR